MKSTPREITPELLRSRPLPRPDNAADKDERGLVLIIAGSVNMPGGALLAGTAALRAGAGKLRIATVASAAVSLGIALSEAYVQALPESKSGGMAAAGAADLEKSANHADAILIGPGMVDREELKGLTLHLLRAINGPPFLLDAEALVSVARVPEAVAAHEGRVLITPHSGEMASLLDRSRKAVDADPESAARDAAKALNAVVALKGSCTWIVTPEGESFTFNQGHVGLATSGSGDVLAGIATGLLARGATPLRAAIWSVFLHGIAGQRLAHTMGGLGFLARELLPAIPPLMGEFKGD
jgi:ADP-dependent NAD(P)H-hydrate dehydratase